MKNIFAVILLLSLPVLLPAQTRSINKFYNKYKHGKEVMNFTIPGWVIRFGTSIAIKNEADPDSKAALEVVKKIRKMKLLVMKDKNTVKPNDIQKMIDDIKRKDKFEELIYVRDEGTRVNMLIRSNHEMIENLLIVVSEVDEFVLISLNTSLRFEDLNKMLHSLKDEIDFNLDFDHEEPVKAEPVVKKEPQV